MTKVPTEAEIESRIQANAIIGADVDEAIDPDIPAAYHVFPGTTTTVCLLTMRNGYTVTGASAAVSLAHFDREVGELVAYKAAREKIWPLVGYALRCRL